MVAGGVLAQSLRESLHSWQQEASQGDDTWSYAAPSQAVVPRTSHSSTSFNAEAGGGGGHGEHGEKDVHHKMGLTEDEEPCQCTDPPKKKKRKGAQKLLHSMGLGWLFGKQDQHHDEILEKLKQDQQRAERGNANAMIRAPYKNLGKKLKAMETEILSTEEKYAKFKHEQEEYLKDYKEVQRQMKWHCKGLRARYKGIRFDCERERKEAQEQFFARRLAPECLIGKQTPFDEEGSWAAEAEQDMVLPPDVVVALNMIARCPTDGNVTRRSGAGREFL